MRRWWHGAIRSLGDVIRDLTEPGRKLRWVYPAGTEMTAADWSDENALAIALYLDGSDDPDRAEDERGCLMTTSWSW